MGVYSDKDRRRKAKWISCLARAAESHAHVVEDRDIQIIWASMSTWAPEFRQRALETLVYVVQQKVVHVRVEDMWINLRQWLPDLVSTRHAPTQRLALRLIKAGLAGLRGSDLQKLIDAREPRSLITTFQGHPNALCRNRFYEVLYHVLVGLPEDVLGDSRSGVHAAFLCGLGDTSVTTRRFIYNFWDSGDGRLPEDPSARLLALFETLYAPGAEPQWLHYAGHLLLSLAKHTDGWSNPNWRFESPLSSKFAWESLHVDASWDSQSQTMHSASQTSGSIVATWRPGFVRATQDTRLFSQTQTQMDEEHPLGVWSTQMLASQATGVPSVRRSTVPSGVSQSRELTSSQLSQTQGVRGARFVSRTGDSDTSLFSVKAHQKARMQQAMDAARRRSKGQAVKMYRRYRKGEVPDTQVGKSYMCNMATLTLLL
jgi:hypothetical protein